MRVGQQIKIADGNSWGFDYSLAGIWPITHPSQGSFGHFFQFESYWPPSVKMIKLILYRFCLGVYQLNTTNTCGLQRNKTLVNSFASSGVTPLVTPAGTLNTALLEDLVGLLRSQENTGQGLSKAKVNRESSSYSRNTELSEGSSSQ